MPAYPVFVKTELYVNGKVVKRKTEKEGLSKVECNDGDEIMWKGTIRNIGGDGLIRVSYTDFHTGMRETVAFDRISKNLKAGQEIEVTHKRKIKHPGTHHIYFVLFFWTGKSWAAPSRKKYWTGDSYSVTVKAAKPPTKPPAKPPVKTATTSPLSLNWGTIHGIRVGIQVSYDPKTRTLRGNVYQQSTRGIPALKIVYVVKNTYSKEELESPGRKEFEIIEELKPRLRYVTTIKGIRYGVYPFSTKLPENIDPKDVIVFTPWVYAPLVGVPTRPPEEKPPEKPPERPPVKPPVISPAKPVITRVTAPSVACPGEKRQLLVEIKNEGMQRGTAVIKVYVNNRQVYSTSQAFAPNEQKRFYIPFTMPSATARHRVICTMGEYTVSKEAVTKIRLPEIQVSAKSTVDRARPGDGYSVILDIISRACPSHPKVSFMQDSIVVDTRDLALAAGERETLKWDVKMPSWANGVVHTIKVRYAKKEHTASVKVLPKECCIFEGDTIQIWPSTDQSIEFTGILVGKVKTVKNATLRGTNVYFVVGKAEPNDFAEITGSFGNVILTFSKPLRIACGDKVKDGRTAVKSRFLKMDRLTVMDREIPRERLEMIYNKVARIPRPFRYVAMLMETSNL